MTVSIAAERLAYAEDVYDRMCRDEDATPAQIEAATAALHAAQTAVA